ncbi:MAG: AAA family ATPase, partial [Oscillospiraceae bacterium]|nr:AAA family ATPase [Oscillospiraceae bacterium]
MLPVKLKMQAFASYAEAVEIDFEKLDKLFLIHGDTGSGKTAILDAMMFALYGASSGDGRSAFRCAFPAAKELPTEVEFTFRSGGNLYKFVRIIRITPRSKKQESRQDCFIYDDTEGRFRAVFENPTATRVNEEAVRITGLEADQFRQVVILPQGKFERLLTSNSEDKEKTFSTLFASDKYTAISEKLSEMAARMREDIDKEDKALQAVLATENAESISALEQLAEENEKRKNTLFPLIKEAEQKLEKSRERLTAAEVAAEKFKSMENAVQRLSELDKLSDRISFIKSALVKNAEAAKLRPEYMETITAAETLQSRKNQLAAAKNSVAAAERNFTAVSEKGGSIAKGEKLYKARLSEMAVLSGFSEVYDKIEAAEGRRSRLSRELADVEKNCLLLAAATEKTNLETEKLTAEQSEIQEKYALALPALLSRKAALEVGAEAEKKHIRYKTELQKIEAETARLKNEAAVLEQQKNAAEKNYDNLYLSFIANTAAELSSSLKEGIPCPVCGSTEHPCPAQVSGGTVTSEDVKNAKQAFESAYDALAKKINELNRQENRIPDAHKYIAEMAKAMEDCGYSSDELKRVSDEAELAQKKNDLLPQLRQRISELSAHQLDVKNKSDEAVQRKIQLQSELSAANAEASALRNQLDKRYPDAASYKAGLAKIKAEIEKFEREKAEFDEAMKTAEKRRIETSTALAQAEEEILTAQRSSENANKNFSLKLSQAGFPTVDEYRRALLSDSTVTEYTAEAERYDLDRHALNERIVQLRAELEGKEKPELDVIRLEAEDAQREYSEKSTEFSIAKQRDEQLKKLIDDCSARFAETEKRREKYMKLAEYAKFMIGSKGISFTRYILGIILGLVVDEANSILSDVHGGRFRLCVKTEATDKRSKHGLDLEVETITADGTAKYGVKDLSGGEKFLISLALSLGLSSVVQSRSGGIKIEAMF